jgi:methionyl-tRNA formyltransferase
MNPGERSVLFLGKAEDPHTARAAEFCRRNFSEVSTHAGRWGDPLPETAAGWSGGLIVSYLARWIVPAPLLARAVLALNFHPGPPEYPGYGCNNFAIYEGAREYGVTCHHMAPRVDTGAIVEVLRFPVFDSDNAGTLLARAYDFQLVLFYGVLGRIIRGEALPVSRETWARQPFTRKQFSELGRLTSAMTEEEIARRKRALDVGALKPAP